MRYLLASQLEDESRVDIIYLFPTRVPCAPSISEFVFVGQVRQNVLAAAKGFIGPGRLLAACAAGFAANFIPAAYCSPDETGELEILLELLGADKEDEEENGAEGAPNEVFDSIG